MAKFNPVWFGIGHTFTAENVIDALNECDLDFDVGKSPLLATEPNSMVPDMVGTYRTDNGHVLGVVGKDYGVVVNRDAFGFADLISDLTWQSGGYTSTGLAFLVGHLPDQTINGEVYTPYIVFQNSFNRRWLLRGQVILVDKLNGYTVMLPGKTDIKVRHAKYAEDRVRLAKEAMLAVQKYIETFAAEATELQNRVIDAAALEVVVSDILFPIKANASEAVKTHQLKKREEFLDSYNSNASWRGTAWGVVKAFADFTAKANAKAAQKNARKAETAFENTLISGKNYDKLINQLENL